MSDRLALVASALREAFAEGFSWGADHENASWKYPPPNIAWRCSTVRAQITGDHDQTSRWRGTKIDEQRDEDPEPLPSPDLALAFLAGEPAALTDDECDEFRRMPCSFRDMVRGIWRAGRDGRRQP